ncbi:hypothetical protein LM602_08385 [Candidatus Acetothermia bacterium]|nr:hypothetical protein [Candidatus Acetothermia bacterium]MCI2432542.1 hypothetical protein [Candidatus Acetothermia bacterium]MCI2436564.1 hypothetical protein [Candidatus Acetothermia bacterium]
MSRFWVLVLVVAVGWTEVGSALAQTVGVGVRVPVEMSDFHAGRLADNLEIFGQAALGPLALEAGVLMPFSPLVLGATFKFSFFQIRYLTDEGEQLWTAPLFIGGGGILISFGELSFTAFVIKAGLEWHSAGFPLRAIFEGGWQSPIAVLQGAGGPFLSFGLRWDL